MTDLVDNYKIAESFRRFGLTDATRDLLVIKISASPEINHGTVGQHLENIIEGTPYIFDDQSLRLVSDVAKIKKAYKLGTASSSPSQPTGNDKESQINGTRKRTDEQKRLEMSIIGAIALRGSG